MRPLENDVHMIVAARLRKSALTAHYQARRAISRRWLPGEWLVVGRIDFAPVVPDMTEAIDCEENASSPVTVAALGAVRLTQPEMLAGAAERESWQLPVQPAEELFELRFYSVFTNFIPVRRC